MWNSGLEIGSWKQFARKVRGRKCKLLKQLDDFPHAVLVTGCQRSGTTILSRIITQSDGMVRYWFGSDDELDAALILSGQVNHKPKGRYCFQTTYLNECYKEYFEHQQGYKVIWVLRNPYSVVYSLLHNWTRFALNELFSACGSQFLHGRKRDWYNRFGMLAISRIERACLSFNGKVSQLFELKAGLSEDSLIVVEYNDLVERKSVILPLIYEFIELPYKDRYADALHPDSLRKSNALSSRELRHIETLCLDVYNDAKRLVTY